MKWPGGKRAATFRKQVKAAKSKILTGSILAIDPSSGGTSLPGWALFEGGLWVSAGVIEITRKKPIEHRLRELHDCLTDQFDTPDVLAIEEIKGATAHDYLKWSVGVSLVGVRAPVVLQVPIGFWKLLRGDDYDKTDFNDAVLIGRVLLELCGKNKG